MGREWERIKRYENTYYVSSEGYRRARRRQKNEASQNKLQISFIICGAMIVIMGTYFSMWFLAIGLVMVALGWSSLHLSNKRKRAR